MKVMLKDVRLAFPAIFSAESVMDSDPKFSAVFLFAVGSENHKLMDDTLEKVAEAKWGAKGADILRGLQTQRKLCLHEGAEKPDYEGFGGLMYVSSRSEVRPTVVDRDKTPLTQADGKPYAGCYVDGSIEVWAQDNQFGKRINASLRGVRFLREGDAFGGVSKPADLDEFDDLSTEEDLL
jgi:hypothetical protein